MLDDAVINGAAVSIPAAAEASIHRLELDDGTLDVEGRLTISGIFLWHDGRLKGAGQTVARRHHLRRSVGIPGRTAADKRGHRLAVRQSPAIGQRCELREPGRRLFEFRDDVDILLPGAGTLTNAGTLRKSGGTDKSQIYPTFHNMGAVDVTSGELDMCGNGTSQGTFNVAAGAQLGFVNRVGAVGQTLEAHPPPLRAAVP